MKGIGQGVADALGCSLPRGLERLLRSCPQRSSKERVRPQVSRRWPRDTAQTTKITRLIMMIPPRPHMSHPDPDQSPNPDIIWHHFLYVSARTRAMDQPRDRQPVERSEASPQLWTLRAECRAAPSLAGWALAPSPARMETRPSRQKTSRRANVAFGAWTRLGVLPQPLGRPEIRRGSRLGRCACWLCVIRRCSPCGLEFGLREVLRAVLRRARVSRLRGLRDRQSRRVAMSEPTVSTDYLLAAVDDPPAAGRARITLTLDFVSD
jgi:hypothetical protein